MIFKMTESFLWVNVLLRRRKLFKVAHGRHKIMQYVDCVSKELRGIPAFRNYSKSFRRTFSETNNKLIPSFVKLLCLLSFEVCFCRDILPSFCLVRLCTNASSGIRLKPLLVSRIRILSFCPLFDLLTRTF